MSPSTQRFILIGTIILMILFVFGDFIINHLMPTNNYSLNTANQPTIGNLKSNVEVVVFLEPTCEQCKQFNNEIFPKIKKNYIETNKIKYTVIPVSYLNDSMPLAEGLLCVYYQDEANPNAKIFFTFLDYLFKNWTPDQNVLELAKKADPAIKVEKIEKCMERHVYFTRIKQNTAEGMRVTGRNLEAPAIFINGVQVNAGEVLEHLK